MIERVQQNVRDITAQVNENSVKLGTQNEYFQNVFQSMQDMTGLLNRLEKRGDLFRLFFFVGNP